MNEICEWNGKECIGKNCVWYNKTKPILGKLCPLIEHNSSEHNSSEHNSSLDI